MHLLNKKTSLCQIKKLNRQFQRLHQLQQLLCKIKLQEHLLSHHTSDLPNEFSAQLSRTTHMPNSRTCRTHAHAELTHMLENFAQFAESSVPFCIKKVSDDRVETLDVSTVSSTSSEPQTALPSSDQAPSEEPLIEMPFELEQLPELPFSNKTLLKGCQPGRKRKPPNPSSRRSINYNQNQALKGKRSKPAPKPVEISSRESLVTSVLQIDLLDEPTSSKRPRLDKTPKQPAATKSKPSKKAKVTSDPSPPFRVTRSRLAKK